ncbi:MAG: hypothetical protein ACHBNF_07675, partial [Chromatiales bacterium]
MATADHGAEDREGAAPGAAAAGGGDHQRLNAAHRHDALGLLTPEAVHYGRVEAILEQRRAILAAAYAAHPERFVRKPPEPLAPPTA